MLVWRILGSPWIYGGGSDVFGIVGSSSYIRVVSLFQASCPLLA